MFVGGCDASVVPWFTVGGVLISVCGVVSVVAGCDWVVLLARGSFRGGLFWSVALGFWILGSVESSFWSDCCVSAGACALLSLLVTGGTYGGLLVAPSGDLRPSLSCESFGSRSSGCSSADDCVEGGVLSIFVLTDEVSSVSFFLVSFPGFGVGFSCSADSVWSGGVGGFCGPESLVIVGDTSVRRLRGRSVL